MIERTTLGEEVLRQGKVAAFLVAGGQGTRLRYHGPKGCFPIGPVSGRSLFQWHAEQIAARSWRYGQVIPWCIMTSRENDEDTREFFQKNRFFGLSENDIFFFSQEMVPCLDLEGKLFLSSPCTLAMNPNGHGGCLSGLVQSGATFDMRRRGIEYISYFQVDNPLVTICDPAFIGCHVAEGAQMSSKVLKKHSSDEKIGAACLLNDKPAIVEYIDLDFKEKNAMDSSGKLVYWAGSIAIHCIDVDFVEQVADKGLPWHRNNKKVSYFDGKAMITPEKENAVKFETFVFDALQFVDTSVCMEVVREHEFAPVKNIDGEDSVVSCRRLLSSYFHQWLNNCGIKGNKESTIEISPLYSLDAFDLSRKVKGGGFILEDILVLG